jgi:hypothetical protein
MLRRSEPVLTHEGIDGGDRRHASTCSVPIQATLIELIDLANRHATPLEHLRAAVQPLHEHLDELVDTWRELSDNVAERRSRSASPPTVRLDP